MDIQCFGSRFIGTMVRMLTQPDDIGRAAPAIGPRRFILIAEGLGLLADPQMQTGNLGIANNVRLAVGEGFALDSSVVSRIRLGVVIVISSLFHGFARMGSPLPA